MPLAKDHIFYGMNLTDEQRVYVDSILDNNVTVVDAAAGTGKTTMAIAAAALLQKEVYYIFAPVQEDAMGYRPGTQAEKEAEYTAPAQCALAKLGYDPFQSMMSMSDVNMIKKKLGKAWVFTMTHIFARGIDIEDKVIIIDEAQNWTVDQLEKVISRAHDDCKVIIIGHRGQCDLPNKKLSGFYPYICMYKTKKYAKVCQLTKNFRGVISRDADEIHKFISEHKEEIDAGQAL